MKNRKEKPKTWSRKGRCPSCNVGTGSKHTKECSYIYDAPLKKEKEIENKEELLKILKTLPIKNKAHRNAVICSLIGHSRICTTCFGYRYCGRCGDQLGDSLGSVDYGIKEAVIVGHNCPECKKNYEGCTWKDKLYAPNPFKKKK